MINTYLEHENVDLCDPAVAQNGENGNRILISISEHLHLEMFATKYLRLVFQGLCFVVKNMLFLRLGVSTFVPCYR